MHSCPALSCAHDLQCRGNRGNHGIIPWYNQFSTFSYLTIYNAASESPVPHPCTQQLLQQPLHASVYHEHHRRCFITQGSGLMFLLNSSGLVFLLILLHGQHQLVTFEEGMWCAVFAFYEETGRANTYIGNTAAPYPFPVGSGGSAEAPLQSALADGFHSSGSFVGPTLINNFFTNLGDDGIAIHGHYYLVVAVRCHRVQVKLPMSAAENISLVPCSPLQTVPATPLSARGVHVRKPLAVPNT